MLSKKNNGITLVALVITIVILLILAGISISALSNTGIFQKAKDAKKASENAEKEQRETLGEYEKELNKYIAQELTENKINTVLSKTENTVLKDKNGNVFTLPAGFKVVVNGDTGNEKTVDKGIVIEDATVDSNGNATPTNGSQFVWVPVGDIKKDDGNIVEIGLNRYTFEEDGTPTPQGENDIKNFQELETSNNGNTTAKNITEFKLSVAANRGYYIGRYEARKNKETNNITEIKSDLVYNFVTQPVAANIAKGMYNSKNFTSDLINGFAWDTALVFIQNSGSNNKYSTIYSLNIGKIESKGTDEDIQCNIYDIASNLREWSTETFIANEFPCTIRGGYFYDKYQHTSTRNNFSISYNYDDTGFRPILYINI